MRQTYALPSPNAHRLQNRRWQCAPRTLDPAPRPSRPPRVEEQSACYLQHLGPLMALPSRRGASQVHFTFKSHTFVGDGASGWRAVGAPWCSRLRAVRMFGKTALSPRRGAHFAHGRVIVRQHGSSKLLSCLRAVRILKNELSPVCGAHFHVRLRKTNVFDTPPLCGTRDARVLPRSRLRGVLISEENGALAGAPCTF